MLQLCINWECVGGLRLTLPGVLQLEQPWELYCHIRGYSYNPRGAQTLAHPALQSLMNYATEAVFILLSVPLAWISVSYLFWQEEGGLQSWLCVPVKDVRILESRLAGGGRLCMSLWVSMRLRWCPENDGQGCLSASARPFQAGAMKLEPSSQGLQDWSTPHTHQHHSAIPFFPPFSFQSFSRCSFSFNIPLFFTLFSPFLLHFTCNLLPSVVPPVINIMLSVAVQVSHSALLFHPCNPVALQKSTQRWLTAVSLLLPEATKKTSYVGWMRI